jgi:hypothetical protein
MRSVSGSRSAAIWPNPARHDGTVDLHPAARVNVGLAMQWEMVTVFRDEDMGEQRRPGASLFDRQRRHGRLDDRLAGAATHLGAHMQHTQCDGTYSRTVRSSAPIRPNLVGPQVGQTQGASCTIVSSGR